MTFCLKENKKKQKVFNSMYFKLSKNLHLRKLYN